jgi:mono/diheme cytochrome c family protein
MLRTAAIGLLSTLISSAAFAQTPAERGAYLVNTIMTCQNCHTPKGPGGVPQFDKDLSGGLTFDEPPFKVTASNLTPDKDAGIGAWSEADIRKALVEGVRPNGVPLAAVMPSGFYGILTPGDLNAIVAHLKTLKPVSNKVADPVYKINLARQVFPGAEKPIAAADLNDKVKKGFYLATIGHCMECHTPFVNGPVDFKGSLGKGGREFPGPWGVSMARNITSHKEKGIGAWSDDEIKRAITQGVSRDGSRLKPPMGYPFYAKMTGDDLDAIVAYLRTVPPKD